MNGLPSTPLRFHINGDEYIITKPFEASYTLAEFLRDDAALKGTKVMCKEGGCGACVVTVTQPDPVTGTDRTYAVNSCLAALYSMHGCRVTTVEGLGDARRGYHPVQKRIADYNGSQCGYCTPGMVMSVYGLLCDQPRPSETTMERALDGNLCRCTGYRPLNDAAKSFAADTANAQCIDIEDLSGPLCRRTCQTKHFSSGSQAPNTPDASEEDTGAISSFGATSGKWYRATDLRQVYDIMNHHEGKKIRFVVGNTANGIAKAWYDVYIDTKLVPELHIFQVGSSGVEVGANLTLTSLVERIRQSADSLPDNMSYLNDVMVPLLEKIAGTPIRNAGCWAGNLMIQHDYPGFPSDLVPTLVALDALIAVGSPAGVETCSVLELLKMNMKGKIIVSMTLPPLKVNEHYNVTRVQPRFGNAHSFVTAAIKMQFDDNNRVVGEPRIAFVGISKDFTRAVKTEQCIKGKCLLDQTSFKDAVDTLKSEAVADFDKIIRNDHYKTQLATHLFYKFVLKTFSTQLPSELAGLTAISTPELMTGKQDFETFEAEYPVTKAMPKMTSRKQAAGEAVFTDDLPKIDRELIGIFVPSPCAKAKIANIDTTEAMKIPGVHAIYTAKDVPGKNFIIMPGHKLLAEDKVDFAGQPVALLLAENERAARRAGRLIKINLTDHEKPIVDVEEAIEKNYMHQAGWGGPPQASMGDAPGAMETCDHVIEGSYVNNTQFHFYLENQIALAVPTEDGLDMTCASQHPDGVQAATAAVLDLPANSVTVRVSRVGGAFGGKAPSQPLALCALGAYLSQRPVRLSCSLKNATESLGKRYPTVVKYKAGVSSSGQLQALIMDVYQDMGYEPFVALQAFLSNAVKKMDGCYTVPNILVTGHSVKTDRQHHVAMRAPEMLPLTCAVEHIMDHVARSVNVDPIALKRQHLMDEGAASLLGSVTENPLCRVWDELMESAQITARQAQIEAFNKEHRWVKRGLAVTPTRYTIGYGPFFQFPAYVAIYGSDGTVSVAHGGVEMGQGINTKAAQIAAKTLGIPLDMVKVKQTETLTGNNGSISAGSRTTEMVCRTVQECCKILKQRLEPLQTRMRGAPWSKVAVAAQYSGIDLSVSYRQVEQKNAMQYNVFGAGAAEAEVDILTGETRILRFDGIVDNGQSMNPDIDVGQIEGALIIGLGYQLYEREVYDPDTGKVITNSTWDYKPPSNLDIPMDMRITILKNTTFTQGVLPAKAIGEPPICMSPAFLLAVKRAVESSRAERGNTDYFTLNVPATPDRVLHHCDVTTEDLVLQ